MERINKYISITKEKVIEIGEYEVGDHIPAGEYYIFGEEIVYILNDEKCSNNPLKECYVILTEGNEFKLEKGIMVSVEFIQYYPQESSLLEPGHLYRVGREVPVGYYLLKFDEKYFKEKISFLEQNECRLSKYQRYQENSYKVSQAKFGCAQVDEKIQYIEIENGCAIYYGDSEFVEHEYIEKKENSNVDQSSWHETISDVDDFLKLNIFEKFIEGWFIGGVSLKLQKYYWYEIDGICKWIGFIQSVTFINLKNLMIEFTTEQGDSYIKEFFTFGIGHNMLIDKQRRYGESYILNGDLPKVFYGKKINVALRAVNGNQVNENLNKIKQGKNNEDGDVIREAFNLEFEELRTLLYQLEEVDVEKELSYFEKCPDLINYVIQALSDVVKYKNNYKQKSIVESKISFVVSADYDKDYYCIAKIADKAEVVTPLSNKTGFMITFSSLQLQEIELVCYILYYKNLNTEPEDSALKDFLLRNSIRYYTINRMIECMSELNQKFGYSTKATNSVVLRVIKSEKKKMKKLVDKIYSDVVKENRVQTKWGNEYKLFSLISKYIDGVEFQFYCEWLGQQSLDMYIEQQKVAIEYQGEQHYRAIDFFGGLEAFEKGKKRDELKKQLCESQGVRLLEWNYNIPVTDENVQKFIREKELITTKKERVQNNGSVMAPVLALNKKKNNKRKETKSKSKYSIEQYDIEGELVYQYTSISNASKQIGISTTSILKVIQGKRKTAGGYVWKRVDLGVE